MHGLLPAKIKRRTLSLAAVFAVPAAIVTAALAPPAPAQASPGGSAAVTAAGRLSVTIDSMNPQVAIA